MAVRYDTKGQRHKSFADAVAILAPAQWGDWPVPGPRTVAWVARFILENGGSALGHDVQWRSNIRLTLDDITVPTHHVFSKIFETALCYDRPD
eukprot:6532211-Pyramimonas_sp.AAC.1